MIGASTFPAADIVEAQWVAERRGLARFRTEQPPCSILNRSVEREVLPACQRYGMGVMAWSPLAKGMLTGKYRQGAPRPDTLRARSAYSRPAITRSSLRRRPVAERAAA